MHPHTIRIGLVESKLVIDVLSLAYDEAKRSGKPDVEVELSNPKFLDSVQQLWSNIPKATRTSVDGNLENEPLENNRPRKYRKLTRSNKSDHSDNTLPPGLMAKVSDWKNKPLSFFDEGGVQLNLEGAPLAHAYNYLIRLVKRTDMDIIRGRLLKVVFHRLRERLGVQRLRLDRVEQIARIICRSGIVKESDANTIRKWLDDGNTIDGLCREIGSVQCTGYSHLRNLFYLNNIADSRITRLKLDGECRRNEIQELNINISHGLHERMELEKLANLLMGTIWEAIENSIPEFHSQGTRQTPTFQVRDDYSSGLITQTSTFSDTAPQQTTQDTVVPTSPIQNPAGQVASRDSFSGEDVPSRLPYDLHDGSGNGNPGVASRAFAALWDSLDSPDVLWDGSTVVDVSGACPVPPVSYTSSSFSAPDVFWDGNTVVDVSGACPVPQVSYTGGSLNAPGAFWDGNTVVDLSGAGPVLPLPYTSGSLNAPDAFWDGNTVVDLSGAGPVPQLSYPSASLSTPGFSEVDGARRARTPIYMGSEPASGVSNMQASWTLPHQLAVSAV